MTPEDWYLALYVRLQRYAVQKFGIPVDEAEGIVHDVFLSFLMSLKPIRDPRAWFFGGVSHACRDYLRKQGRIVTGESLPEESAEPQHLVLITAREMLRALPEIEGRVLWMQFAEGYTVREIAVRMGWSVSWTEKRLRRARRDAAQVLGHDVDANPPADEDPSADDDETHRWLVGRGVRAADTFGCAANRARKVRMIRGHVCPLRGTPLPRTPFRAAVLSADRCAARQVRRELSAAHGLLQIAAGGA